ncbi:MAG: D-2-hydroxyacid dehydrogenase family protein, partial [Gammaproteobacteria bacterium]
MKIAILDDFQDAVRQLDCFRKLENFDVKIYNNPTRGLGQLAIRLAGFDALVLIRERTPITRALLARLPQLKLIAQTGRASGHIDVAAATERGVVITESASSPVPTAELTWALIMAATRKLLAYANNLKAGQWQTASVNPILNGIGTGLHGRTLAIWGYGRVGRLVAGYGRAFGMRVLVWGSEASRASASADGFEAAGSRAQLFEEADVLTLHLRLADATRALVNADDFARMKPTALFVNTSRAELVADNALEEALRRGRPFSAALDVFASEPLPVDAPLLRIPTVLATPHLGYVEKDGYELYFGAAFQNIVDFARGEPRNVLNPGALGGKAS